MPFKLTSDEADTKVDFTQYHYAESLNATMSVRKGESIS
jgi:hypothetical protein